MTVITARDAMRERFARADAGASLREAALAIRAFRGEHPDADVCALFDGDRFEGLVAPFDILKELGGETLDDSLRLSVGPEDFEETFREKCSLALARPASRALDREVPAVSPSEPLFLVMDAMLRSGRRYAAVVEEGELVGLVTAGDALLALRLDAGL